MWVGKQREELNIRLEGKDIKQVNSCVYLGGNISENGRVDVEVRRRRFHSVWPHSDKPRSLEPCPLSRIPYGRYPFGRIPISRCP